MTKRTLLAILLALAVGCTKTDNTVNFRLSLVEDGLMTRADIVTSLESFIPEGMEITLTDGTNTYTVYTNEDATIPVGTYKVEGYYCSEDIFKVADNVQFATKPFIKVDTEVQIREDIKTYTVDATYDCFVFAIDYNEATEIWYRYGSKSSDLPTRLDEDNRGYVYGHGEWDSVYMSVKAVENTIYEEKEFCFGSNGIVPRNGRYYFLHPDGVEVLTMNLPTWIEGEI